MWSIIWLVLSLIGVLVGLFLWFMTEICCFWHSSCFDGGGSGATAVTKVKGHADEGLVARERVREVDRIGNSEADVAADLGRKRVHRSVSDARRLVNRACVRWYPMVCELHRFFIAIARAALNNDGLAGTSLDPVVWAAATNPKRRRVEPVVRNFAWLLGPPGLWTASWFQVPCALCLC